MREVVSRVILAIGVIFVFTAIVPLTTDLPATSPFGCTIAQAQQRGGGIGDRIKKNKDAGLNPDGSQIDTGGNYGGSKSNDADEVSTSPTPQTKMPRSR